MNIAPMIISIWLGDSKPSNLNEYLREFVTELNKIVRNGVDVNGHLIRILIRAFICDSPARSFIKGILLLLYNQIDQDQDIQQTQLIDK